MRNKRDFVHTAVTSNRTVLCWKK